MAKIKKGKLAVNIVCGIIIALLLLGSAALLISKINRSVLFIADRSIIWIQTGSMEDLIPAQSFILVRKIDPKDVKPGDVIMFYSSDPAIKGQLNTHRVVEIIGDNKEFVTRGDNKNIYSNDTYHAKAEDVVAIYEDNVKAPIITALFRFFLKPIGFIVIISIFVVLTVALCIPDIKKAAIQIKQDKEKKKEEEQKRLIAEEVERLKRENQNKQ